MTEPVRIPGLQHYCDVPGLVVALFQYRGRLFAVHEQKRSWWQVWKQPVYLKIFQTPDVDFEGGEK